MWSSNSNSDKEDKDIVEKNKNHIYFYSSINRESIHKLNMFINELNFELTKIENGYGSKDMKIYLHINSGGGKVFAALACVDYIRNSKYPIITIIEGCCASAATFLSLMGSEKRITKSSFMLIHQLSSGFWGKMSEIEDEYKNLQSITSIIKKLYNENSNLPKSGNYSLTNILKHDLWLTSDKCLELGLVDYID